MEPLRRVVLERLIRYYRYLGELSARKEIRTITSAQLGAALDIDPTQVRKDFGAIGLVGISRVGYDVCEVCRAIRLLFGFDHPYDGVLVGAGHLGSALLAYGGFIPFGLRIVAAFDNDPAKVGRQVAGLTIHRMEVLRAYVRDHDIGVGIVTTPASVAQSVTDQLVASGVKAIWNFSPVRLHVSPGVLVRNEHISLGLAQIAYHLNRLRTLDPGPRQDPPEPCREPCAPPRL